MFTQLSNWFSQLDSTMQLFWACAIAASVVFIIQNALMLMGLGDMDADVDADVSTDFDVHTDLDADGVGDIDVSTGHTGHEGTLGSAGIFSLFTLRNFINFFLGFGWGGISFAPVVKSTTLLVLIAFACGLLFVAVFVVMLRALLSLERNGSFRIQDCVGQTASVYLRIPANHAAAGKIQISVNGSVHELNAFTDGDFLPTGSRVRVVKVIDSGSLLVEKL
ncbi:MAG: NfeD family protein [Bacteroidaceae bacterium]|nr:NfeD family protein [Bacteroidaceae bacterium]